MISSRFLHIPTASSGGPGWGGGGATSVGAVRLTCWQYINDGGGGFNNAQPPQTFQCVWVANKIESITLIRYGEWLYTHPVSALEVIVRFYDDVRGWWWEVAPGLIARGVPWEQEGFQGSEDDTNCTYAGNNPGQFPNTVLDYGIDPLVGCTGQPESGSSLPGMVTDFDPDFCSCDGVLVDSCIMVADLNWQEAGHVNITAPPTIEGVRKYSYVCKAIP